jgi:hypothetical protein
MARPGFKTISVTQAAHADLQALRSELQKRGTAAAQIKDTTLSEIIREGVRLLRARAFPEGRKRAAGAS